MKNIKLYLFLVFVCLLYGQGNGLAQTMYVTDRLYLSLRNAPDPEQTALDLLPSDTKVDVLETQGKWAKVMLEDGRTGWVWKRYLVKDVPKSLIIERLKRQIENKDITTERLLQKIASRDKEITALKNQISQQNERLEMTTKENTLKRLKGIYGTGIVALLLGLNIVCLLIIGYLVRRSKRTGY